MKYRILIAYILFQILCLPSFANETSADSTQSVESTAHEGNDHSTSHDDHGALEPYDPAATAIHHISDANVYSILDVVRIPLPMFLYAPDKGWDFFSSGKFHDITKMAIMPTMVMYSTTEVFIE